MKKIRNEQRYSNGKGDNKNRGKKSQREFSSCSTVCKDKPKKYVRPLVHLYPEYIKYMIRK